MSPPDTKNTSTNIEEQNQLITQSEQENASKIDNTEDEGNVYNILEAAAIPKETVQILKVELVIPGRDHVDIAGIKNDTTSNESVLVVEKEKQSLVSSDTEALESMDQKQINKGYALGAEEIESSDTNVQLKHVEQNVDLNSNLGETMANTTESIVREVQNQVNKKDSFEAEEMETSITNVQFKQVEENANLNSNSAETISNTSETRESVVQTQTHNDDTFEVEDIVEKNANLNINAGESIANASEPLGAIITTGLSLLAQYHSDDDSDSVVEIPTSSAQDYRNKVIDIDSDSSSDDSSDSSGVEYLNELRTIIKNSIEVADEEDEEDNEDNTGKKRHPSKMKVKGEMLLEDLPPIQDLQITVPEDECIEFGKIHSIVDQLVLVSALHNSILLDLETVIFLEKGQKVLGEVFDVLGQVADPLYCVRFNSNNHIKEKQINIGDNVYVAPKTQYTQYVILSNLIKLKGSDASWENDVEPPPRFLDYSDDEQEQLARRQLRNKDRPMENEELIKRPRGINDDSTTNVPHTSNTHLNRYSENRPKRGGFVGHSNTNKARFEVPLQQEQGSSNRYRSSWHSNYYPQSFPSQPTGTDRIHSVQNQHQSQGYPIHVPAYIMPPVHNMRYPPPQPMQYGPPPTFHRRVPPNMHVFNMRSATVHSAPPHASSRNQYTSTPPPPPGSQ